MPSDRPQVKYRVDPGVKRRFEEYVDEFDETGQGRYGRHLERAMRQYMGEDRLSAIQNRVGAIAEAVGAAKKKGKEQALADGAIPVPAGKNPGDVEQRQRAVSVHLIDLAREGKLPEDGYGYFVTQSVVTKYIKKIAGVESKKTVKRYLKSITAEGPFRSHPERAGTWVVEP